MARIRTIKPEFPQSESMGRISRDARLLFILLWTQADDFGRLRGNSRMLASLLFPYDDDAPSKIDVWFGELLREGCVRQYEVDGKTYIDIPKWKDHQKIDHPSKSHVPEFRESSRGARESSRGPANFSPGTKDQGPGREGSGEEGKGPDSLEPDKPASKQPLIDVPPTDDADQGELVIMATFPCVGASKEWQLTNAKLAEWQEAFPAMDVPAEVRKARQWLVDNPGRMKTAKGMTKFLFGWLERSQNRKGGQREDLVHVCEVPTVEDRAAWSPSGGGQ